MSDSTNIAGKKNGEKIHETVITTHVNADFDALASMIAAQKLYPEATLVFPGSQEKNLRNFFLHTTSYIFNFLKVKQVNFKQVRKLVLVDTRQKSRIGKFAELIDKGNIEVHIYDHHPDSDEDVKGSFEVVQKVGATTSILAKIIQEKGLSLSPDEATIMCLGIHEDTGSFSFSSTKPEDYQAAAWLTEQGANHNIISDMLTRELTAEQIQYAALDASVLEPIFKQQMEKALEADIMRIFEIEMALVPGRMPSTRPKCSSASPG